MIYKKKIVQSSFSFNFKEIFIKHEMNNLRNFRKNMTATRQIDVFVVGLSGAAFLVRLSPFPRDHTTKTSADSQSLVQIFCHAVTRAGQTQTFLRLCVFAHRTQRHFRDAMGEDATGLKQTQTQKTQRSTDANFLSVKS